MRAYRGLTHLAAGLLLAGTGSTVVAQTVFYPKQQLADTATGLMESFVAGYWYRGTAVVARDPKLLYSCAHLFYEQGEWATDFYFHRAYHGKDYPAESAGASPRGLHYFSSYSSGVDAYGQDSNAAFSSDFTVLYGNNAFSYYPVSYYANGGPALRSGKLKRIVGYPSRVDYTGVAGHCYQHSTDWFTYDAYKVLQGFNEFENVSTGPGNSGGPVFVQDSGSGASRLAGNLVSGSRRTAGVIALDLSTHTLSGYALGLEDQTQAFRDDTPRLLPDGASSYTIIPLKVSGFSGTIQKIKLNLNIATARRGDLDVYLRSPSGKIRWIAKKSSDSSDNLVLSGANLTRWFGGYSPNGEWQVRVRDAVPKVRATFQSASLTITGL